MIDRRLDPRTEDTIVFELLRGQAGGPGNPIGRATFRNGRATVEAADEVTVAVSELLAQAFVDRVTADERPRGYRRSGSGQVEMLVPGMPEHFIARLRGLWLPYPDGTVVTARPAGSGIARPQAASAPDLGKAGAAVIDPSVRRATLAGSDLTTSVRPLVAGNEPLAGLRQPEEIVAARTDCGWLA